MIFNSKKSSKKTQQANHPSPVGNNTPKKTDVATRTTGGAVPQNAAAGVMQTRPTSFSITRPSQRMNLPGLGPLGGEQRETLSPLGSPRKKATDAFKRLLDAGQIVVSESATGELRFRISRDAPEQDLFDACRECLSDPAGFAKACAFLDACLRIMPTRALRHELLSLYSPCLREHYPMPWPAGHFRQIRLDIQLASEEPPQKCSKALRRLIDGFLHPEIGIASALNKLEDKLDVLAKEKHPELATGQALMQQLQALLRRAALADQQGLAKQAVAMAERVLLQYPLGANPSNDPLQDATPLHQQFEALNREWQQATCVWFDSPAFEALLGQPQGPVLMQGSGAEIRFTFQSPERLTAAADQVVEVCRLWLSYGWEAEALRLLDQVMFAVKDLGLQHQLFSELASELMSNRDLWQNDCKGIAQAASALAAQGWLRPDQPFYLEPRLRSALLSFCDGHSAIGLVQAEMDFLLAKDQFPSFGANAVEHLLDQIDTLSRQARYDFALMRRITGYYDTSMQVDEDSKQNPYVTGLSDRLLQVAQAHPDLVPPELRKRCAQMHSACSKAEGRLRMFDQRWTLSRRLDPRTGQWKVRATRYRPGDLQVKGQSLRGLAKTAREEEQMLLEEAKALQAEELAVQNMKNVLDAERAALIDKGVLRKGYASMEYGELTPEEKNFAKKETELTTRLGHLNARREAYEGALGFERMMFIADIDSFLDDPHGPDWPSMVKLITKASGQLNWQFHPRQWGLWGFKAFARNKQEPLLMHLEKQIEQHGLAKAQELWFDSLMEQVANGTPWSVVDGAIDAASRALKLTLSVQQQLQLCLAALKRDHEPEPFAQWDDDAQAWRTAAPAVEVGIANELRTMLDRLPASPLVPIAPTALLDLWALAAHADLDPGFRGTLIKNLMLHPGQHTDTALDAACIKTLLAQEEPQRGELFSFYLQTQGGEANASATQLFQWMTGLSAAPLPEALFGAPVLDAAAPAWMRNALYQVLFERTAAPILTLNDAASRQRILKTLVRLASPAGHGAAAVAQQLIDLLKRFIQALPTTQRLSVLDRLIEACAAWEDVPARWACMVGALHALRAMHNGSKTVPTVSVVREPAVSETAQLAAFGCMHLYALETHDDKTAKAARKELEKRYLQSSIYAKDSHFAQYLADVFKLPSAK